MGKVDLNYSIEHRHKQHVLLAVEGQEKRCQWPEQPLAVLVLMGWSSLWEQLEPYWRQQQHIWLYRPFCQWGPILRRRLMARPPGQHRVLHYSRGKMTIIHPSKQNQGVFAIDIQYSIFIISSWEMAPHNLTHLFTMLRA